MLKKYIALTGIAVLATASMAFAEDGELTNSGDLTNSSGKITIGSGDTGFTFQTSPQVTTGGTTTIKTFVIGAVHNSALEKKGGTAYAMSSETSGLYSASVAASGSKFTVPELVAATSDADVSITGYTVEGTKTDG